MVARDGRRRSIVLSDEEKAKYAEENSQGWTLELGELRDYVSTLGDASPRR